MNEFLEASSDPYHVFLAFLASTLLAHYFWVFKKPLSLKQWRLVDYMWLMLAGISIFGIVEEARFFRTQMTIEVSKTRAENTQLQLDNWFDVYNEYACDDQTTNIEFKDFCLWTRVKLNALELINENEDFPVDIPSNFVHGLEKVALGISVPEQRSIQGYLREYRAARTEYLTARNNNRRSEASALIVSLAPLLFAIAIGIKLAKVTGEYRLTKR